jgi:hypothetical protein
MLADNGRNWARTSDLQLVELALSQLSYAPGGQKCSAGNARVLRGVSRGATRLIQATGAVGALTVAGASGSMPLARAVTLKVSRVSYLGCQSAVDFSFSVETTHG